MKYFRAADGKIWGFDNEQIAEGYGSDMTPLTPEETEAFLNPQPSNEDLKRAARQERDRQLAEVYDKGINMALRGLRLAATPEEIAYAQAKIAELDAYALALTEIPEHPSFPQGIAWPTIPTP